MKKMAFLNVICSVLCQFITIISGLIVPRLLLSTFGSETNGLVSSLTQFLNYISLVEGGIGGVVLASLYSPLAKKNNKQLNAIIRSSQIFFKKISYIFIAYTVVIAIVYPFIVDTNFSWIFIFTLTIILSISLFVQYFFSITYKLLLQADQKMYIIQLLQICTTLINLVLIVIIINYYPNIHIIKLFGSLAFLIQPIVYTRYINKHYNIDLKVEPDKKALSQRWSCFGQNLAYFIHSNTDVVVLSVFTNLKIVSVYAIYHMVIIHIQSFFKSFSHAFSPIIGKFIAIDNIEKTNYYLDLYEFLIMSVSTIVFGCCIYLLPSFCLIYTNGVNDVNYYQPIFSTIIVCAEMMYIISEPYLSVIYGASRFAETAMSSYIEAVLNIILSLVLVKQFGLIGVAIGTFIAMLYRLLYLINFISKDILYRSKIIFVKRFMVMVVGIVTSVLINYIIIGKNISNIIFWIKSGFICFVVCCVCTILLNLIFDRKMTINMITKIIKRKQPHKKEIDCE